MPPDAPTIDDALGPLAEVLLDGPDPAVRTYSALTLGQSGRPEAIAPLIAALSDPEKQVRSMASRALAGLGPVAVPALIAALEDRSWVVRYRAAEALGGIEDPRVSTALLGRLQDAKDHVRYMAAKGLAGRPDPSVAEALLARLDDENPFVRKMAARALETAEDRLEGPIAARVRAALRATDDS